MLTFSALIAGSIERIREINQAIPRAPELQPGPEIDGTMNETEKETRASIARLGLKFEEADALLLAAAARPPCHGG
jgi:hypothetical protein